jgi:hypothetical protein
MTVIDLSSRTSVRELVSKLRGAENNEEHTKTNDRIDHSGLILVDFRRARVLPGSAK